MSASLPPKQLSMAMSAERSRRMPRAKLAPGFELRAYRPGDEDGWIALIGAGEFGSAWDRRRFEEYIAAPERREGSRVAAMGGRIAAATFASVEDAAESVGRVDFVVSHPDVRGLGLGRAVCSEVTRYLVGRGYGSVMLYTDDWRLPAIGLYLSMGFEPQMSREDMPARWRAIMEALEGARASR